MRCLLVVPWIVACGSPTPGPAQPPDPRAPAVAPATPPVRPGQPWPTPAGFRSETIAFPLDFAPRLAHQGVEELRFAPGFFDPAAPGYWSYAFVWRTQDPAALDAAAVGAELTAYFRGLIEAVDEAKQIANRDSITVRGVSAAGARVTITAHVFDAFKTKLPLDLVGWAERRACGGGALWRFVMAPAASPLRPALDALAAEAGCDQPVPPPPAPPSPSPPASPSPSPSSSGR
jgi:hypothetical protein